MKNDAQSMKAVEKQIANIEKKIIKTKNTRIHATNVTTLAELKSADDKDKKESLVFAIQACISSERCGVKNIAGYAEVARVHRQTFKKYVDHYKKYSVLPTNGNVGREPKNKIKDSVILKIVNETTRYLEFIESYTKEPVPTSWSLLYRKIMNIVNKKDPRTKISLSTFTRKIKSIDIDVSIKYETHLGKKLRKRLILLKRKLEELKLLKNKINVSLKEETIKKKVLSISKPEVNEQKEKVFISKRRNQEKPGVVVQWDGSMDQFKNKTRVTRMQAIDHNTLATMGLSFVKNENNKGFQMVLSQIIDNCGIPEVILGDKRKGVDPVDAGALNAIACKLLGITLNLDSNSIHKAELESLNGKMHPFITYHCAENNVQNLNELNKDSQKLIEDSNNYFKREKVDYSHLRQASEEVKEILRGKIKQVYIKSSDGVIINKRVYQAEDENGKVNLERWTWSIVSFKNNLPAKIWTDKGIYRLVEVSKELNFSIFSAEKIFNISEKYFIDNGSMIMNRESYETLCKEMRSIGYKDSINHHLWKMDEQIKERMSKLQKIARQK